MSTEDPAYHCQECGCPWLQHDAIPPTDGNYRRLCPDEPGGLFDRMLRRRPGTIRQERRTLIA